MLKKKLFFLILLFLCIRTSFSSALLIKADSLFEAGKFIMAMKYYDSLFQQNLYSPQMFWRMAYIKESLGQYTDALIYLNLCYHYKPSTYVLQKMNEIATKRNLKGYNISDVEYLYAVYRENQNFILLGLFGVFALWLYVIYRAKQKKESISIRIFVFIMLVACTVWLVNKGLSIQYGIIIADEAYLMNAPSSGSSLLTTLAKGNRVRVLGEYDIWFQIQNIENDSVYFVRKAQIYPIH